jgi:hypothetical protein
MLCYLPVTLPIWTPLYLPELLVIYMSPFLLIIPAVWGTSLHAYNTSSARIRLTAVHTGCKDVSLRVYNTGCIDIAIPGYSTAHMDTPVPAYNTRYIDVTLTGYNIAFMVAPLLACSTGLMDADLPPPPKKKFLSYRGLLPAYNTASKDAFLTGYSTTYIHRCLLPVILSV